MNYYDNYCIKQFRENRLGISRQMNNEMYE